MAGAGTANSTRIELLNKRNYDTWCIQAEALFVKNDTWQYISGESPKPVVVDEGPALVAAQAAADAWTAQDRKAKSDLILSVSPDQLHHLRNCNTSKEVWDKLKSVYASQGPMRKAALLEKLLIEKMRDEDDIRDYLSRYMDTVDKLRSMDIEINDVSSEQMLIQRLAELQVKLQYLDTMYRARQEDLQQLTQHIDQISIPSDGSNGSFPLSTSTLKPEVRQLVRNMSGMNAAHGLNPPIMLRLPSSFHFLPHLLDDPASLRLAYLLSKGRTGVSVVLGIPTVRREKHSYLMETLQSLIDGMSLDERDDALVVIFVAETEIEYVLQIAKEIELRFSNQVDAGLIEVVSPSPTYYPDMEKLRRTLGDSQERVKWRSKQNLDFAFLMSYCQPKGTFYVQLEDDILAKPYYITEMKKFALEKTANKEPWFVLDFCQLGFIGKMFKSAELPWLIQFFQMFYNDKPVDWLLEDLIYTKICNSEKNKDFYKRDKAKLWIHYKPSLFQHIGTHSSLKGKVQKLKDKQFGKVALFFPHSNPDADVISGIKCYKQYSLQRAYQGETFFWGLLPQPGDQLVFKFRSPTYVKRFFFRSGNAEHPSDKFYNTTVEVLPSETNHFINSMNVTSEGYVVVGKFDNVGIATGNPDENIGRVSALRLYVHSESDNWAILSEIHIQDEFATSAR